MDDWHIPFSYFKIRTQIEAINIPSGASECAVIRKSDIRFQ